MSNILDLGKVYAGGAELEVLEKLGYDATNNKLTTTTDLSVGGDFTANSIVENMTGYSFTKGEKENVIHNYYYAGIVKTGNKLTMSIAGTFKLTGSVSAGFFSLGIFRFPTSIGNKLYPITLGTLDNVLAVKQISLYTGVQTFTNANTLCQKTTNNSVNIVCYSSGIPLDTEYSYRYEITFLLSDNLVSE